ncbi:ankyrin, partial [Lepidopterella palustris CBS 459.81]
ALHYCARQGDLSLLRVLVERLQKPVDDVDSKAATPLMVAVQWNRNAVVQYLLNKGASVHAQDKKGWTVLHHAILRKGEDVDLLRSLLERGANVNATNNDKETPLHFTAKYLYNMKNMAEVLLSGGADIEARDIAGRSPLWLAMQKRKYDIVELLLKNKAKVDDT